MSYLINVWERPVPRTLEEAEQILDQLLDDQQVLPRPRLEAFARALWNRWPRDVGNASLDPVWSDTSLGSPHDGSPLLQFGVVSDHLDEVVPFVTSAAAANGLVAYDPQFGTVYLPGGSVLGMRPPPARKRAEVEPMTRPQAIRAIRAGLKPVLEAQGFRWTASGDEGHFAQRFAEGEHRISAYVETRLEGACAFIHAHSHLQAIDAEMQRAGLVPSGFAVDLALIDLHKLVVRQLPAMQAHFDFLADGKFVFARKGDVERIAKDLGTVVETGLRPLLGRYESLAVYWEDSLARLEVQGWPEPLLYPVIVAGKLLGDARHRALALRERERLEQELERHRNDSARAGCEWNLKQFLGFLAAMGLG